MYIREGVQRRRCGYSYTTTSFRRPKSGQKGESYWYTAHTSARAGTHRMSLARWRVQSPTQPPNVENHTRVNGVVTKKSDGSDRRNLSRTLKHIVTLVFEYRTATGDCIGSPARCISEKSFRKVSEEDPWPHSHVSGSSSLVATDSHVAKDMCACIDCVRA
jgi:hypothetical protein